ASNDRVMSKLAISTWLNDIDQLPVLSTRSSPQKASDTQIHQIRTGIRPRNIHLNIGTNVT
ncbi:hypothetical protein LXA00_17995, partial [Erwinia amylovora]|uniref:hypothetical protein n=1 Tax=Erwinia amylovora TaxID=552 RepID=UPI0020C17B97